MPESRFQEKQFEFSYLVYTFTVYYNRQMKTLSLKLDDIVYEETEQLLEKIKTPRNRYINEALHYYNRIQKRKIISNMLVSESKLVSEESMKVLHEFENLDEHGSKEI